MQIRFSFEVNITLLLIITLTRYMSQTHHINTQTHHHHNKLLWSPKAKILAKRQMTQIRSCCYAIKYGRNGAFLIAIRDNLAYSRCLQLFCCFRLWTLTANRTTDRQHQALHARSPTPWRSCPRAPCAQSAISTAHSSSRDT